MSVYTKVAPEQLVEFLAKYSVGKLVSYQGISAGIENTNYFVDTDQSRFVLTIFEHHQADELSYFLNIMAFMAEQGIPTAHPQADLAGNYLNHLCGKPAALVERLPGNTLTQPNLKQCQVMASTLARFHQEGMTFPFYRANDRSLDWAQQTFELIKTAITEQQLALINDEIAFQQQIDWTPMPQSVIHADLFTDNAMFDGEKLTGIIDLYYACQGACLYDLAVMVNDWCRNSQHDLEPTKVEAVLTAYDKVRPLTDQEQACWPAALRLAALRFYLSRLKDAIMPREGEITMIKDPKVFETLLIAHRKKAKRLPLNGDLKPCH
ncbi:homoserine kinase [Thiomicrospira aerophila AL3]|uniref:Homoserine kinase n=2 Tax=Thiomicrospira aerophila TaxID=92245 RepID=W0DTS4_9GAMM|nr:homoserine kinase [Thiomicrospira aerophila AL3]